MSAPCDKLERDGLLDPEREDEARAHIAGCARCQALWDRYQRMLGALPELGASHQRRPDYQARLWAAIERDQARRRRWPWRWSLGLAAAAAALLLAVVLRGGAAPREVALHIDVTRGQGPVMRSSMILPGDHLRIRTEAGAAPHHALRVYRNDVSLLLACPGDARCAHQGGAVTATLELDARGRYQVLWLVSPRPLPPASSSLSGDVAAAAHAGADYRLEELEVR